jgi:hypothetical protein
LSSGGLHNIWQQKQATEKKMTCVLSEINKAPEEAGTTTINWKNNSVSTTLSS